MKAILSYHKYRYYPYEKVLARREASQLLGTNIFEEHEDRIEMPGTALSEHANRLTYFAGARHGRRSIETLQAQLERASTAGKNRQATRYSVHGLHEYKGKFNPQIVKAVLNIFGIVAGDRVLDPFCGSGTTLVECSHIGATSTGYDLNPFAVFIANAKLSALSTPAHELSQVVTKLSRIFARMRRASKATTNSERMLYLSSWFTPEILDTIESVRCHIEDQGAPYSDVLLAVASNLLRDYSLQDPNDLRIRRRQSPLPSAPFPQAFIDAAEAFVVRLSDAQSILVEFLDTPGKAILKDATVPNSERALPKFDAVITSPPYATALPYIDTQRLSLVWMSLIPPDQILQLESELVGSRELRGAVRENLRENLEHNVAQLPLAQHAFCMKLKKALGSQDGFRRLAVPVLLYRYLSAMQDSFLNLRSALKRGAPYALVVGHNHTVLSGTRFNIDTPFHLVGLAMNTGWKVDEIIPLQTYQRYGYHMENGVAAETLLLLRRP